MAAKWAMAGTGHIAGCFAQSFPLSSGGELAAVSSRSAGRAESFAALHGIPRSYGDFGEMLSAERPDIVYIATPNDTHFRLAMRALESGCSVLCEKPMPDSTAQLEALISAAEKGGRFLMEGMWTRCFPAMAQARKWLAEGRIGRVLSARAAFDVKPDPASWQMWKTSPEHSAGALRDVGVYPAAFAMCAFPEMPERIFSSLSLRGGVDSSAQMMLRYRGGGVAFLSGSFDMEGEHGGVFMGELGRIEVGPPFWRPHSAVLVENSGARTVFDFPFESHGFQFEITRVNECLASGLKENPDFSWNDSRILCSITDFVRREWGVSYPSDSNSV